MQNVNIRFTDIEATYRLSPIQEGMLLHTLLEPNAALFFQQMVTPTPNLDADAYTQAWQKVVDRHPILRTSFHWEGVDKPYQAIHKKAELPVKILDWSNIGQFDMRQQIKEVLQHDRKLGFDLTKAPILRITLIHTGNNFYYVIKSHHHIILDGWSGGLILKEVQAFYRGIRRRQLPNFQKPRSFGEYLEWLEKKDLTDAEKFWTENLRGIRVPTPLPGERSQVKKRTTGVRFYSQKGAVSPGVFSALQRVAKRWRVTPSTVIHGIWALLLAIYSAEKHIIFGSTFSGRPAELNGVDSIPGVFINVLPVRVDIDEQKHLEEWFREVHEQILKIQQYEYSPLVQVQGWSSIQRGTPMFATLLVYNSAELYGSGQNKAKHKPSDEKNAIQDLTRKTPSNDPLILTVVAGDGLTLDLTADARRLDQGVLVRLLDHLNVVVEKIIANPDGRLDNLLEVHPAERNKVLYEWNQTEENYPRDLCLHQLIDQQAGLTPTKVAVVSDGQSLTYEELIRQSDCLAQRLIAAGIGSDQLVGVFLNRSSRMMVALLGILKAGGAYLPLDPAFPSDRLAYMLEDSGASVLISEHSLEEFIPQHQALLLFVEDESTKDILKIRAREASPSDLAYLLYTSGSTGRPKGVMVEHRHLVNFLWAMRTTPGLDSSDVLLAVTTLSFDIAMLELFLPLIVGASVEIVSREVASDATALAAAIFRSGATVMQATPTTWRLLIASGWEGCQTLKVLCGGEALTSDLARPLLPLVASLWNMYGPTETTIWSCVQPIHDPEEILIGRPIANTFCYVLDKRLKPVAIGVDGELYIAGDGVVRGYHNRPDLTAKNFMEDPFSETQGSRMYRTGDLARWLPSGELKCLGRTDQQVKVRGYRIEMGEVEAALGDHPDVKQSAVDARPDPSGGLRLVGYIVPNGDSTPSVEAVRSFMSKLLPDYMIPAVFVPVTELPLTANLKVDRKALPDPDSNLLQTEREFVAPRNCKEKIIAEEWIRVLQVESVGVHDNFFNLGGHSLLATQVISRIQSRLDVKVPIPVLFEYPTVAGLAHWIKTKGDSSGDDEFPLVAIPANPDGSRIAPQSFAQQRLWFLSEVAAGSALYNLDGTIPFEDVDFEALQKALTELARRQESLRTTFATQNGEPVQIVAAPGPMPFEVVDLRQARTSQLRKELQRLRREEKLKPFDLARGPVVRFKLVILDDHRQVLLYCMHHIITDGWSTGVFGRELRILYQALSRGNPQPLPEPTIQYADFAAWQNSRLKGEELEKQIDYWRQHLTGLSHLELPLDRPRPAIPSYRSSQIPLVIPEEVLAELNWFAQGEKSTLFMLLLAAFQFVLGQNAGQNDVAVGTPIANRTRAELENIIGFFVNSLVMRTDLSGKPSFRELLSRVRKNCLEAYGHQDLPFDRLVEELAPKREPNVQPMFQVMFVLQNTPSGNAEPRQGQSSAAPVANNDAGMMFYDLTLSLADIGGRIHGSLHYNTDLFDQESAESFCRHFLTLLNRILLDPDEPLSAHSIISDTERELLLERSLPGEKLDCEYCIQKLFEDSVDRDSAKTAVVYEGSQLSYGELDGKANQLAHYLIHLDVVPGTTVGLYVERGLDWIVGLIAILKAGGVYLPLNPELPPDRLDWMLEDSAPSVILTREEFGSRIPEKLAKVLPMGSIELELQAMSAMRPKVDVTPQDLAYIIYTSGSTGRPKGVMIEHHSLCQTIIAQIPLFGVTPESRVLSTIAPSFDASLGEIFRSLLAGATLYLAPREQLLPGPDLIGLLKNSHITTTTLVPTVLAALPDNEDLPELTTLTVGGEVLSAELARRWGGGRRLINGYGPTETTIGATLAVDWPVGETPPLGYPLPGVRAYVLDREMELLPDGVPGELYLGGAGLARGYLNQADLTQKSFVDNPFCEEQGSRLYRTGDRVRWRSDGQLAFLGRMDEQVKIRGHRVEPGEISAVLEQYPGISEGVVVARQDSTGGQRLVAYVVAGKDNEGLLSDIEDGSALIAEWHRAYEMLARRLLAEEVEDLRLNFTGWTSSYNDENIPQEEMASWADATVDRIRGLKPKNVLEIGSGSGLVLLRLAPFCEHYTGLDFSAGLLDVVAANMHLIKESNCKVELIHGKADELAEFPEAFFDTVVINSVAQYFPDIHYFLRVLEKSISLLEYGGTVFLGDLRNFQLLDAFHASVLYSKASAALPCNRLWQRVCRYISQERELFLSPQLFSKLLKEWPRVTRIQIMPKAESTNNELSTFRYDVIVHLDTNVSEYCDTIKWLDWNWTSSEDGLLSLRKILANNPLRLGVRSVPNSRTANAALLVPMLRNSSADALEKARIAEQNVADLRKILADTPKGTEPETLMRLAQDLGYRCELSWFSTGPDGCFDVIFIPNGDAAAAPFALPDVASLDWDDFANNPGKSAKARNMSFELRAHLSSRLPSYMVPSAFIQLDALPLTAHGKIDRNALPNLEEFDIVGTDGEYAAPASDLEGSLVAIWANLLQRDRIGVNDNFFDLGGHSLLATQVIASLRTQLDIDVPITAMFAAPTIAKLANWIEANPQHLLAQNLPPLVPSGLDPAAGREAQQSFSQQRLWFVSLLNPGSTLYNSLGTVPLSGELDFDALENALTEMSRRHQSLRTTFTTREDEPIQVIAPLETVTFQIEDLRNLPTNQRRNHIQRIRQAETAKPFDLVNGPVARYVIVIIDDNRQILLVSLHHIITDGWSMGVLRREIRALYGAYRQGSPSPLPEPIFQYADFATWQRSWLRDDELERQLEYWRKNLADAAHLGLPMDRARPAIPRYRAGLVNLAVPRPLAQRLGQLAREEEVTMFMLLLAAFQYVLGQNAGQEDVVVGTPIANRSRAELKNIIGFFVNSLVMRTDLSGKPSFRELLRRVRQTCLDAYSHQDLPFDRLVEELAPRRELNVQPLFQVLFVLEITPEGSDTGQQVSQTQPAGTSTDAGGGSMHYDLTLNLAEVGGGLRGAVHFNTDLFNPETAERIGRNFLTLLSFVVSEPNVPLSSHAIISDAERKLLQERAFPSETVDSEFCIHRLFEDAVDRDPMHIAVVFQGAHLNYAELNCKANQLANFLISLGVAKGDTVGLCVERGFEWIVGLLGILKAGGTYIPLNPELPQERLAWMLKDSAPSVILAHEEFRSGQLKEHRNVVTFNSLDCRELEMHPATHPGVSVTPQDLAYIIYTSGSTGRPKGVMIEHHSLCHTIVGQIPLFGITSKSRVLSTIAPSFDASLGEIFRTLLSGATLYLAPRDQLLPGPDLIRLLKDNHITTTTLVPTVLAALPDDEPLAELKTLTVGGEALSAELARRWGGGRRLINGYGPTETTIGATLATDWPLGETPPLGYPLPGVRAYVLGSEMELLPDGVPGELYLGGPGLARGYLHQPDLTAESFVKDPFSEKEDARLYRTGDRVRWRVDGQLVFLGRLDDQIKIRGYRVEPGEISTLLEQYPGVSEAVVVAQPNRTGGQQLVAYIVAREKKAEKHADKKDKDLVTELRRHLASHLPNYMVPSAFILLETLPRTVHGKLDRKALPEPEEGDSVGNNVEYVEPTNETERILASIWTEMLRVERVGIYDNFFDLGGDSILSIRVIARAAEAGITLTAMQMYQHQNIKDQALVAQQQGEGGYLVASEQGIVTGDVPLTPIQCWFFEDNYNPEPHHFNWATYLPTQGGVSEKELQRVMEALTTHHDALRLRFTRHINGEMTQRIAEIDDDIPVTVDDVSHLANKEQQAEMESLAEKYQASLNLAKGPLLRLILFQRRAQPDMLLLIVNHLVNDAISWQIIREDIMALMQQLRKGEDLRLPPKTASFKQWSESLRQYVASRMPKKEKEYWLDNRRWQGKFARLSMDRPGGDNTRASAEQFTVTLNEKDTQKLLEVARAKQMAPDQLLLSSLAITLGRRTGCWRCLINVERHGREDLGAGINISRTVGWFPNISPVLFDLTENAPLDNLLRQAKETLDAIPNNGIGYSMLKYIGAEDIRRKFIDEPQAELFFNYFGQVGGRGGRGGKNKKRELPSTGTTVSLKSQRREIIQINAMILHEQLQMTWAYSSGLHDKASIDQLAETHVVVLGEFF